MISIQVFEGDGENPYYKGYSFGHGNSVEDDFGSGNSFHNVWTLWGYPSEQKGNGAGAEGYSDGDQEGNGEENGWADGNGSGGGFGNSFGNGDEFGLDDGNGHGHPFDEKHIAPGIQEK